MRERDSIKNRVRCWMFHECLANNNSKYVDSKYRQIVRVYCKKDGNEKKEICSRNQEFTIGCEI